MAARSVLITGGLGFIGRQAIGPLVERGFGVHIRARSISPDFGSSVASSAIASLIAGRAFLASAGQQIRDFTDVRDVAAGLVALLDSPVTGDVNVASGEPRSVASVLMQIGEALGRQELIKLGARPRVHGEPERLVASVERLRKEVKWKPTQSFEARLEDTVAWWKKT